MSHLKKNFKYHNRFANKYVDQTYLAYLCRGNKRYIARSGDFIPHFIVTTIDFIIRCNNNIARRGSTLNAIVNIKNDYNKPIDTHWYIKYTIKKYYDIKPDVITNDTLQYVYDTLQKIKDWEHKFESDFEGFKDFIFDEMKIITDNHYDWVIGENIIYDRSIRDNLQKRVYCTLNNEKVVAKFKKMYFGSIYVEPKDKAKLYKQIDYLLTTIADVNNYLLTKENVKAIELLQDYFDDNEKMETCKDIYYLKVFYQLHEVYNLISQGKNHDGFIIIQKIIENENNKYITSFTLFESVAIDLQNSTYSKIINI